VKSVCELTFFRNGNIHNYRCENLKSSITCQQPKNKAVMIMKIIHRALLTQAL
jgi:hypothetical protein